MQGKSGVREWTSSEAETESKADVSKLQQSVLLGLHPRSPTLPFSLHVLFPPVTAVGHGENEATLEQSSDNPI